MASLNHAKITNALDAIVAECDKTSFFFDFLLAYGTPKTTISRIQAGDAQRNLATIQGDIAVPQKMYFRAVQAGSSVVDALAEIRALPVLERGKIRFVLPTTKKWTIRYCSTLPNSPSIMTFSCRSQASLKSPLNTQNTLLM